MIMMRMIMASVKFRKIWIYVCADYVIHVLVFACFEHIFSRPCEDEE